MAVASRQEHDQKVQQLMREGFKVQWRTELETGLIRPNPITAVDVFCLVLGTVCFVLPGIIYFIMWLSRPALAVVVSIQGA